MNIKFNNFIFKTLHNNFKSNTTINYNFSNEYLFETKNYFIIYFTYNYTNKL